MDGFDIFQNFRVERQLDAGDVAGELRLAGRADEGGGDEGPAADIGQRHLRGVEPVTPRHLDIGRRRLVLVGAAIARVMGIAVEPRRRPGRRSEGHTSDLQSLMRTSYAVFRLQQHTAHKSPDDTEALSTPLVAQTDATTP